MQKFTYGKSFQKAIREIIILKLLTDFKKSAKTPAELFCHQNLVKLGNVLNSRKKKLKTFYFADNF